MSRVLKAIPCTRQHRRTRTGSAGAWAGLALGLLLLSGGAARCGEFFLTRWMKEKLERPVGPGFTPSNVYQIHGGLPPNLRRVAVLPMTVPAETQALASGREALQPLLERELSRRMAFEVVVIPSRDVRRWTGKADWRADEPLPEELFTRLREQYSCQAVVFAHLSQFHPYGPIEIGWKIHLVDSRHAEVFWAVDEVFSAGVPSVAKAARRHMQDHQNEPSTVPDSEFVLQSPRRFGQFTLRSLFDTLPSR